MTRESGEREIQYGQQGQPPLQAMKVGIRVLPPKAVRSEKPEGETPMWLDEDVKPAGVSLCMRGQACLSDNITHLRNGKE